MGLDSRGRWYRWNKKRTVDELLCLDISWVAKQIDLDRPGNGSFTWTQGGARYKSSIGYEVIPGIGLRLLYKHGGESIKPYLVRIEYTTPNYGGRRPWFICPNRNCGRRVRKLYGGKYYLCRHCHDLTYEVCQKSHKEAYQTSVSNRMTAIRRRLGAKGGLLDPLPKRPRYMRVEAYYTLVDEYQELRLLQMYGIVDSVRGLVDTDIYPDLPDGLTGRDIWANVKHRRGDTSYFWEKIAASLSDQTYVASWNEDDQDPEPDRLTLGDLAKEAGVDYAFALEAVREDLVRPDGGRGTRVKRYRRRLASWLRKLYQLRQDGYTWEDIRSWTRRRWQEGHEDERRWPAGYRPSPVVPG